jgi:aldose 1-epimerase
MSDVIKEQFGTADGAGIDLFTLNNSQGIELKITNYGGIITSIKAPDKDGKLDDVVLGYETLDEYLRGSRYFGAIIGRYANRIARGKFSLNGTVYSLARNRGENHLHGGIKGLDKVVWKAKEVGSSEGVGLELAYLSKDGEGGYPGNLQARVTYILTDNNDLRIEYFATTDKDTVVNLTNHSYFNLAGNGTVLEHELMLESDQFTVVDKDLIPTGETRSVSNTPMDFTRATPIGLRINQSDEQLIFAGGYDHNFVLRESSKALKPAAKLSELVTGRTLEIFTTQPGIQFYLGNFPGGSIIGKGGRVYEKHAGCCLETQHFPDSPNQPSFPTTVLKPAQQYGHESVLRFSTTP